MLTRRTTTALALALAGALLVPTAALADPAALSAEQAATTNPTPLATTRVDTTVVTGRLRQVADGDWRPGEMLLETGGSLLRVDASELAATPSGELAVTLGVPAELRTADAGGPTLAALRRSSTASAPLEVLGIADAVPMPGTAGGSVLNRDEDVAGVHQIFAVRVTPKSKGRSASQSPAAIQRSVDAVDAYWAEQSADAVGFELAATVPWYSSKFSCATSAGSTKLWNQAAKKAAGYGYGAEDDQHLVLFFPAGFSCGGATGAASVGAGVNDGGIAWVTGGSAGADAARWEHALAHELGHNMSIGDADWLSCTTTIFDLGNAGNSTAYIEENDTFPGCSTIYEGDLVDVMGPVTGVGSIPALSSPNAIRSGIWPSDAYTLAPSGATELTIPIGSVTSHEGARALIVPDASGALFFVEWRDYEGEDAATWAAFGARANDCADLDSCLGPKPSVRILRFQPTRTQGGAGVDSFAIAPGGDQIGWETGDELYTRGGTAGSRIQIGTITEDTANIIVTTEPNPTRTDTIEIVPTRGYDGARRVGTELTVELGDQWPAVDYAFSWQRCETPVYDSETCTSIEGASERQYTVQAADLGAYLDVIVSPDAGMAVPPTPAYPDALWGPVVTGVWQQRDGGAVGLVSGTDRIAASIFDFPFDSDFAYRWFRGSTPIPGETGAEHVFVAADHGEKLSVELTVTPPGYAPLVLRSEKLDYSILRSSGRVTISAPGSTIRYGQVLEADASSLVFTLRGSIINPDIAYQWYRGAAAIEGATDSSYEVAAADVGSRLRVKVTASESGFIPVTVASPKTDEVKLARMTGELAQPDIVVDPGVRGLTPDLDRDGLPSGSTITTRWYRDGARITPDYGLFYVPSEDDRGAKLTVVATAHHEGYKDRSYPLSTRYDPRMRSNGSIVITNASVEQGWTVNVADDLSYSVNGAPYTEGEGPDGYSREYAWYLDGAPIDGATASTYVPVIADVGGQLTVCVTAYPDYPAALPRTDCSTAREVLIGTP